MNLLKLFKRNREEEQDEQKVVCDRVVLFNSENHTCEIHEVEAINEERLRAGDKAIPLADLKLWLSSQGRVFVMNAPTKIMEATENLARVERNTIIRQIAQYNRPDEYLEAKRIDWIKIVLIAALVIMAFIAVGK
ncbi:hypothetical protein [Brevibacillus laterosporus]|uniref:Uncharacterized protein n=1 Tax=Brevibacillus laterosporus TaxID=1465 RepID=A0AAP8Q9E6_BRELA|nr:hypothetical protein [Brevibacillus laterosporus]PPA80787.1 hypothetical protein C4A76_25440 [Brevibacillus laterosporus]PPA89474.1 hypothetical protein C4A77_25880 [Brevibacillus laterosporus]